MGAWSHLFFATHQHSLFLYHFCFSDLFSFCITELDELLDYNPVLPNPPLPLSVALRTMTLWTAKIFNLFKDELGDPVSHLDLKVHNGVVE